MAVLPGFAYDIFISYRQNDNRSGWVTEFVKHLNEELAATIKDPVSVYFDSNPHDGLRETHNVDKSLEGKLKSIILIPIISQTYCDPKSFAWQHEFCAFNKIAIEHPLGRDIRISNGNVTSRIIPVKIHDLDAADKATIETEIGGILRAIEFIYREPGVNRPLNVHDSKSDNLNKTDYINQVNKLANAVKDLLVGLQGKTFQENKPTTVRSTRSTVVAGGTKKKITLVATILILLGLSSFLYFYYGGFHKTLSEIELEERSIAVLPFTNISNDPEQDYFSNGMAEDILNHLVNISDLRVKSRTSTLQYKETTKSMPEIGEELGVGNIVEGSVRKVGDRVRIVVQLIDAKNDVHLWSETYDRSLNDILAVQSEIAIEIAEALKTRLTPAEKDKINKEVTTNVTAYDFYLQARDKISRTAFVRKEFEDAMVLINKAIELDPFFSNAFALKASLWYQLSTFGLPQNVWEDSARLNTSKSIQLDPLNPGGYLVRARFERFLGNLSSADNDLETAYRLNPKDLNVQSEYGYHLLRQGDENGADMILKSIERNFSTKQTEYYQSYYWPLIWIEDFDGAEAALEKAIILNPGSDSYYYELTIAQQLKGDYAASIKTSQKALKISPNSQGAIDNLAWGYYRLNEFQKAADAWSNYKEIEAGFESKDQTVPFRHRLAMCLLKLGEKEKAKELLLEDKEIQMQMLNGQRSTGAWAIKGGIHYDLAVDLAFLGFEDEAIQNLDSAFKYQFRVAHLYENDPAFETIRSKPAFRAVQKKVDDNRDFLKRAFANAFNRARASNELRGLQGK